LTEAIQEARTRLSNDFEKQFGLEVLADRLLAAGMGAKQEAVSQQGRIVDGNLAAILDSSKTCYETPVNCVVKVSSLKLANVDESVFALASAPTGSIRIMTSGKGIWSRSDSIIFVNRRVNRDRGRSLR